MRENLSEMQFLAGIRVQVPTQARVREARRKMPLPSPTVYVKSPLRQALEDLAASQLGQDYQDAESAFDDAMASFAAADNIEDSFKASKIVQVMPETSKSTGSYDDRGGQIAFTVNYPRGLALKTVSAISIAQVAQQLRRSYPVEAVSAFMETPSVQTALHDRVKDNVDEFFRDAVGDSYWLYGTKVADEIESKVYGDESVSYDWTDENGREQSGIDWRVVYEYRPTKVETKIDVTNTVVVATTLMTVDVTMKKIVLPWDYDWNKYR